MRRTLADAVDEAAHKPKKPTLRRFTWCRIHHELLRKPLWRLVARIAGAPLPYVKLLVVELDLYASENVPRGSVEGFNVAALAADWGLPSDDQLERIHATLKRPDIGWLDQDFVVTFWDRNPDQEDTTAAARMRRMRERRKAAKLPGSGVVTRNDRIVTTRSDQIIKQEGGTPEEGNNDIAKNPELWLALEGVSIVVRRCAVTQARAETMIRDWRKRIADDVPALARIIAATDLLGVAGGQFADCVRQESSRQRATNRTLLLPFPPRAITDDGHG